MEDEEEAGVGVITSAEELDAILDRLNTRGIREQHLSMQLRRIRPFALSALRRLEAEAGCVIPPGGYKKKPARSC